jgi:hypothetical protein
VCSALTSTEAAGPIFFTKNKVFDCGRNLPLFSELEGMPDIVSQQDDAAPCFRNIVLRSLNAQFQNKWMGRGR